MKKIFYLTLFTFVLFSCSKIDRNRNDERDDEIVFLENETAFKDFAVLLSRAVTNEPVLRDFIKVEALNQFDKDYDIFYPWVKNKSVDGRTFREILLSYDYEGVLESVETELPMLNILVPDWSWIDDGLFSVKTWKTSDKYVGVTFRTASDKQVVFGNGQVEDVLDKSIIPSYPVLVVKNNERMKLKTPVTKGCAGEDDYDFYDVAFANLGGPATKDSWGNPWYKTVEIEPDSEYLPSSILRGRVATAYNTVGACPRDHIYYGMTAGQDTGEIDYNYKETIMRMKFRNSYNAAFYDDSGSNHPDFEFLQHHKTGKNASFSIEELQDLVWADGSLELLFVVKAGEYKEIKPCTVSFSEAFQINTFELKNKYNWIGAKKSVYAFIKKEYLVPRWFMLDIPLFTWDISECPKSYHISIIEKDSGITKNITETVEESYMNNFSVDLSGGYKDIVKIGFKFGNQETVKKTTTYSYQTTESSDTLGTVKVEYITDVISEYNPAGDEFLPVKYKNGQYDLQILPAKI